MKVNKYCIVILLFALECLSLNAQPDTLLVGYVSAPPFIIEDDHGVSGINIWLWDQIARDLNIEYRMVKKPLRDLLSDLDEGNIDICINPLTMTANRSKSMDFTSPFYVANGTAVMKKKGRLAKLKRILSTFFSIEFASGLILLFFIISFFGWLTWLFERRTNPEQFRSGGKGFWDGFWWSAVTVTTVGYGDKAPKTLGGKVIALFWMFTALLFISGLTASIASTLLHAQDSRLTLVLEDMRDLEVGTYENTSTETFLRGRFFRNVSTFSSLQDGFKSLEKEQINAFIYDEPILRYRLLEYGSDKLEIVPAKFNLQLYAFALSKNNQQLVSSISERILHYSNSVQWHVILSDYELEVL